MAVVDVDVNTIREHRLPTVRVSDHCTALHGETANHSTPGRNSRSADKEMNLRDPSPPVVDQPAVNSVNHAPSVLPAIEPGDGVAIPTRLLIPVFLFH